MDLEFQKQNFEELFSLFEEGHIAKKILLGFRRDELASDDAIGLTEPNYSVILESESFKDDLRRLLNFYSLLEISFIIKYIAFPKKHEHLRNEIAEIMDIGIVKRYCFEEYSSLLPMNLADRLFQGPENKEVDLGFDKSIPAFFQFINLYQYLENSNSLRDILAKSIGFDQTMVLSPNDWLNYFNNEFTLRINEMFEGFIQYAEYVDLIYTLFHSCKNNQALETAVASFNARNFDTSNPNVSAIQSAIPFIGKQCGIFLANQSLDASVVSNQDEENIFLVKLNYVNERVFELTGEGVY